MKSENCYFSFNTEGGRCEECKGEGTVTVEMQFMADLVLECESCHGKRFKTDTLEVKFEGKNIYDVLEMTVNQAIEFFTEHGQKKIVKKLLPLQDVGLGYIKLGQSSSTLSGGENQRVKLAYFLSIRKVTAHHLRFRRTYYRLTFPRYQEIVGSFRCPYQPRTYHCHYRAQSGCHQMCRLCYRFRTGRRR